MSLHTSFYDLGLFSFTGIGLDTFLNNTSGHFTVYIGIPFGHRNSLWGKLLGVLALRGGDGDQEVG